MYVHASVIFISDYNCKMVLLRYIKRNKKPKVLLTLRISDFIIRVPASTREQPYTKTVVDKVTTYKYNWQETALSVQNSAKERTDIGTYSKEVLQLPYLLHNLDNTRT